MLYNFNYLIPLKKSLLIKKRAPKDPSIGISVYACSLAVCGLPLSAITGLSSLIVIARVRPAIAVAIAIVKA